MGRFAIGNNAFGFWSGLAVKVGNEEPGPHKMMACSPGEGIDTACGMTVLCLRRQVRRMLNG